MKKTATIRNIIFDLGGVLVRLKKTDFTRFDRQLKLKPGTVRSIIKACTREATIRKRFNERLFFEKHFSQFLPFTTYAKILSDWFATERVNKGLLKWIEKRRQKYKFYLLTNQTGNLSFRLKKKYRIEHHFEHVSNSVEIGIAKPDPRIFNFLLQKIKAPAAKCLFIDDQKKNITIAHELGFHVILFKNNRQFTAAIRRLKI